MMERKLHTWQARLILTIITLAWIVVISGFSAQDGEESAGVSRVVCEIAVTGYQKILQVDMTHEEKETMIAGLETPVRKLAHMTEYAILSVLIYITFYSYGLKKYRYPAVMTFCFACASLDEFHQLFVSGRSGSFADVCIDTSGALLAMLIVFAAKTCYDKRRVESRS